MRGLIRLLPALLLCMLAPFAAAPASADAPPRQQVVLWPALSCATGNLEAEPVGNVVYVRGWILPCASATGDVATAQFSVVYYYQGHAKRFRALTYEHLTGPTSLPDGAQLHSEPTAAAVCLAFAQNGRVACLAIERTTSGTTATPIPTDDPRVTLPFLSPQPVRPGPPPGELTPMCGTCV